MAEIKPPHVAEEPAAFDAADAKGHAAVREARPVAGDVDISRMSRDVLARFPKIIAKLGE